MPVFGSKVLYTQAGRASETTQSKVVHMLHDSPWVAGKLVPHKLIKAHSDSAINQSVTCLISLRPRCIQVVDHTSRMHD